ncbi:Putative MFS multidrug efflux transporter (Eurofung) [Aspergillus calidoustus]|uniref:Putative MFS multidrug efflux transporter (Eurofung) n=1 Tax=Aspergillus calidoustus TaxID=454130 RepID=A0A0U5FUZ4_ASPCI|nr:Putative MFS multidrug efflux transporter (Eurofung) [Aspergillus calidoustus]
MTVSQPLDDQRQAATESTPLLKDASRGQQYTGKAGETTSTVDASSSSCDEDAPLLGLSAVTVAQPEVDAGLERVLSAASANRHLHHDAEAGARTEEISDYADRFINVTPTRFWLIFGGVLFGYIIGFFDSTLMASSHPVITSHFHASNSASWLSTAFLLTSTAFMPLFGRVSDTFGRRPVYLFSIVVFFLTTAWCAAARSIGSFIAARAFCGLGAGGVFSMGMILSSDLVRIEYRGIYQSYINLCLGAGGCLGIAFGGYLCDHVGWRGAFLVQLPFIFIYFLVAVWTTPAELGIQKQASGRMTFSQLLKSIDLVGSALLVIAVTALIMGLNLGGNVFRWSHPLVVSSLVLSVVLGVIFVLYERRVERAVMPIELLAQNPRAFLIFGNFFGALSMNTVLFNAPLYFQAVKLATPTESGLNLLGGTLAATVSSVSTGFIITWSRRLKPTTVIGDIFLILGGLAASALGVSTPGIIAVIGVSLTSLGMGFANPTVTVAVLATSETDEQAVATTTLGLFRNLGSVMGVAISSWIFQNSLIYHLEDKVTGADKDAIVQLVRKSVQAIVDLDPLHQSQVIASYGAALRLTFLSAAVWASLTLLLHVGLRLPRLGRKA